MKTHPRAVLLLGSGALQIGQAGEFDYSGSQALKVLREEGIRSILVNPNIATIQTSEQLADRVYLAPVTTEVVTAIIEREQVDAVMLAFGGQTALNCGLELEAAGVLARCGVRVLGTPVSTIRDTEDRKLFVQRLNEIGVLTARSIACHTVAEAREAIAAIGLPVMLRGGFALGGKGSGLIETPEEIEPALKRAFAGGAPQVLVEESLRGWKEIEYEVVRDAADNCLCVCNMENFDPMGIHTGESIVVAPSQTLDDHEYQMLRSIAIRSARHLGIVGECNIQFALDPHSRAYRVIEVNARLSRSSALASKATGYPLAYVAARIGLGYTLPEIPNGITGKTTAFFEPALDYIICKIPRWDLQKFGGSVKELGSEMKSVGEVMAIGRTFPEALQKAVRMLDIGVKGVDPHAFTFPDLRRELRFATPRRLFAVAAALDQGMAIDEIHELTRIDRWFLREIEQIVDAARAASRASDAAVTPEGAGLHTGTSGSPGPQTGVHTPVADLVRLKQLGFSDAVIDEMRGQARGTTRAARVEAGIGPHLAQIDTTAAEFPAVTNYLYSTYHASQSEVRTTDRPKVLILGSGAYRIGSSVEFDWCAVNAAQAASAAGYETIMLNFNPETVSTDWDVCDQLVFDEISLESVLDLVDRERPLGVVVSMGGQIPNNLAPKLAKAGVPILGTSAENIDRAEDRSKFSALLDTLGVAQPRWEALTDASLASDVVARVGGFPVLVRPSYVLSGAAMSVAHEIHELEAILARAKRISPEHPVVVSKFELHSREIEIDAVADRGALVLWAVTEHVENAGVHSGDATLVLPPQSLYLPTIRRARDIAAELARALAITGPFNVQFIAKHNVVKVIECNLRASRSFPFVSKVLGVNFAAEAMRRMLGRGGAAATISPLELNYVGVKVPMFSFGRIVGADPMLGVEMMSTGEVGCIGGTIHEALRLGLEATGFRTPSRGVLLSLGPKAEKFQFADEAIIIRDELKLPIYATAGTAEMLHELGVDCHVVGKHETDPQSAVEAIEQGAVDLVINIPRTYDSQGRPDGYRIRRAAIDAGVPLFTDPHLAQTVIEMLRQTNGSAHNPRAMTEYSGRREGR
jgi:carbamoyl-phosphate synthase large subunit